MPESSKVVERTDTPKKLSEPETDFVGGTIQWVALKMNWSPALLVVIILLLEVAIVGSIIYGLSPPATN